MLRLQLIETALIHRVRRELTHAGFKIINSVQHFSTSHKRSKEIAAAYCPWAELAEVINNPPERILKTLKVITENEAKRKVLVDITEFGRIQFDYGTDEG